jgi:hypothetical protein
VGPPPPSRPGNQFDAGAVIGYGAWGAFGGVNPGVTDATAVAESPNQTPGAHSVQLCYRMVGGALTTINDVPSVPMRTYVFQLGA